MNLLSIAIYGYTMACVLIPCAVYQILLYRKWDHREGLSKGNLLWRYVFLLYLCMVMRAVFMGSVWDLASNGPIRWADVNLVPFQSENLMQYALNVLLFMPLGFLLPLIWGKYRMVSHTLLAGFLFTLFIELGQLFNHRLTDIDDILMNMLGTAIGFGLWYGFDRLFHIKPREANFFPDTPLLYLALTVFGSFFLDNWRLTVFFFGGMAR